MTPTDHGRNALAGLYDDVPFPDGPQRHAHPRHLEMVATLFGMQPPPAPQCSVLELGCGSGSNLISQAYTLPEGRFVGVDFSDVQIARGQALIDSLGLTNIELRAADIGEVDQSWGSFDYIVADGVYSWVPPDLQDKVLAICRANLAPNGVAYVSYNTFPGWHFRVTVREMMMYHTAHIQESKQQIDQARAILQFLVEHCQDNRQPLLQEELQLVAHKSDANLFHDHLEVNNWPLYFHEFAARAEAHELQYLGESDVSAMFTASLSKKVQEELGRVDNLVRREQYMDFVRNRQFRMTLLCHKPHRLERQINPNILKNFHLATVATFPERFDPNAAGEVEVTIGTGKVRTVHPLVKAALVQLNEAWPTATSLEELRSAAQERLAATPGGAGDENALAQSLTWALAGGMLELYVHPPEFSAEVSERPVASLLARKKAEAGDVVMNMRSDLIRLIPFERFLIGQLDGRSRDELASAVADAVASGELASDAVNAGDIPAVIETTLTRLAKSALLIA